MNPTALVSLFKFIRRDRLFGDENGINDVDDAIIG